MFTHSKTRAGVAHSLQPSTLCIILIRCEEHAEHAESVLGCLEFYVSASLGWHATAEKSIIIPHGVAYPVGQRVMHMCTYMSRYTCIHTCASLPRTNCEVLNQRHKDQTSSHDVSVLACSSHAASRCSTQMRRSLRLPSLAFRPWPTGPSTPLI